MKITTNNSDKKNSLTNISRDRYTSIKKKRITSFIDYNSLDLNLISKLLNQVIQNYTYSTFDLIKLIKENFNGNIKKGIQSIDDYSKVRFNCYYATKLLKEKLKKKGIDAKYVSYKSIGFSSPSGDELIKEAHISLVIPTIRNERIYYIVLDPGYRIPEPMGFYKFSKITNLKIDHDNISIQKTSSNIYPYCMKMKGYNRYSIDENSYSCEEYFNCDYETLNPEEILFPISYTILNGYRIINYNEDKQKSAMIKVMILEEYLECYDCNQIISFTFHELKNIPKDKLHTLLAPFCNKLKQDVQELVEIIYFILNNNNQFISEVMNKKVIEEFKN